MAAAAAPAAMDVNEIEKIINNYLIGEVPVGEGGAAAETVRKLPDMMGIQSLNQHIAKYIEKCLHNKEVDELSKVLILYGLFVKNIVAEKDDPNKEYLKVMVGVCEEISSMMKHINVMLLGLVDPAAAAAAAAMKGGKRRKRSRRVTFKKRKN